MYRGTNVGVPARRVMGGGGAVRVGVVGVVGHHLAVGSSVGVVVPMLEAVELARWSPPVALTLSVARKERRLGGRTQRVPVNELLTESGLLRWWTSESGKKRVTMLDCAQHVLVKWRTHEWVRGAR